MRAETGCVAGGFRPAPKCFRWIYSPLSTSGRLLVGSLLHLPLSFLCKSPLPWPAPQSQAVLGSSQINPVHPWVWGIPLVPSLHTCSLRQALCESGVSPWDREPSRHLSFFWSKDSRQHAETTEACPQWAKQPDGLLQKLLFTGHLVPLSCTDSPANKKQDLGERHVLQNQGANTNIWLFINNWQNLLPRPTARRNVKKWPPYTSWI